MYGKKEVGSLIARLRQEKGIPSQKALADIADVAQSTVRELELGKSFPNMETLAKICDVFDLTLLEFFFMLQGPEDSLLIDNLTQENKEVLQAVAGTLKRLQKSPPETQKGLAVFKSDKESIKPRFKKSKKKGKWWLRFLKP